MNLTPYVDDLHEQLAAAAEAGGGEARALAQRLTAPMDAAVRRWASARASSPPASAAAASCSRRSSTYGVRFMAPWWHHYGTTSSATADGTVMVTRALPFLPPVSVAGGTLPHMVTWALDLDGVLWRGAVSIPGAAEARASSS